LDSISNSLLSSFHGDAKHRTRNPFRQALLWCHGIRACALRAKKQSYFVATAHPGMTKVPEALLFSHAFAFPQA
jgi:hypothetical protein